MPTNLDPERLAKLQIVFALQRLSPGLQSDVLADLSIAESADLEVSHPVSFRDGVVVNRDDLFEAFRRAAAGDEVKAIVDRDGVEHDRTVTIEGTDGFVSSKQLRVRFPAAALLASSRDARQSFARTSLSAHTLTEHRRTLFQHLVDKDDMSNEDFVAATSILAGAPENFADQLREKAKSGSMAQADFIPTHVSHWENLTAACVTSQNLPSFFATEFAAERAARIAHNQQAAIDILSTAFASPEAVPLDLFQTINDDIMVEAITRIVGYVDPMAQSGLFAVCADHVARDDRYRSLGLLVLDRLLGEPVRLQAELTTFAAAFVFATRYLAQHETLQRQPVFWRRLAASAHASLVTRVLGGNDDALLKWAIQRSGRAYYLSVLLDANQEPRWRPDWIAPDYLAADLFGRAKNAVDRLGDSAPAEWQKRIEAASRWIEQDCVPLAHAYPAILQGRFTTAIEKPPVDTPVGKVFQALLDSPSVEAFLRLIAVIYAFGLHPDAHGAVLSVVQALRTIENDTPDDHAQIALELASFVAACNKDSKLADASALVAIERYAGTSDEDQLMPIVATIVLASAALADRSEARIWLARRLENLAFVSNQALLPGVLDMLRTLRSLDSELSAVLGRAFATARLGQGGLG